MKREPEFDHGFYVAVPRMVRTGYAQLSVTQKWLYVCLKDLAGETGTCFRSIQTLKEETGISTGMISMSIHELHKSGLIHAEMKQRTNGGKPVWHITIADIWAANGKAHPSKRSPGEQTLENVHSVNKNVHQVNKNKGERSHNERECSPGETEERKEKKDHIEERKEKKIAASAQVQSPTPNSLSFSQKKSVSGETLVSHPVHSFVWFDDLVNPAVMVVRLTNAFPHPHYSEMEDKRRERIAAWEILPTLKKEGVEVEVRWEHETNQTNGVVEAQTTEAARPKMALTDEQADCWTRCRALTGAQNLTEKAYESVVTLASKVTTTQDLQSLYTYAWERGEEIAKAQGRKATAPNVGTMVHFLPEWEQTQARKQQEKEQDRAAHGHVPGSGSITNWTQARLAGGEPPINYDSLPTAKPAGGLSQVGNISAGLQERIRQARERRATQG